MNCADEVVEVRWQSHLVNVHLGYLEIENRGARYAVL